ncbi:helix-turn-helix domain-containing protein [Nonomuraea sediminis]|uniref:helix-turn-helix domain-containing protein n=1 Tax=Nonomuraea sediminis TaxID=2835864 RepID=UPI001BDD2D41|nr:helix-turn-helix domain-containing protein [Nonomuraea sediminis]
MSPILKVSIVVGVPHVAMHGLLAGRGGADPMPRPHLHPELELNLVLSGTVSYAMPLGTLTLPRRRLVVFWGGYPHRLLADGGADFLWATMPLSTVIGEHALRAALDRLVRGELLYGRPSEAPHDRFLLSRWIENLSGTPDPTVSEVCRFEMYARLARLAHEAGPAAGATPMPARAAEQLLVVAATRYTEDLSVAEIARAAGVHPVYAAHTFKQVFGMPLWEYVTRLRVAHARRLLAGTGWGVDRIAHASGFQTRSAFYRAFRKEHDAPPTSYRLGPPAAE